MNEASPSVKSTFRTSNQTNPENSLFSLPLVDLVTPRRLDLAVKVRLFRHLHGGGDEDSKRVYLWMIEKRCGPRINHGLAMDGWKRSLDDYIETATQLYEDVKRFGFSPRYPIPVDPDGELLNGSHRVAIGLALGLTTIPVRLEARYVWAPPWDSTWFINNGVDSGDLVRIIRDFNEL